MKKSCKWGKPGRPTPQSPVTWSGYRAYPRRVLTGEVQKETKRLITECGEQHGLTLLAMETDEDHLHVFVSAPPRFSPAMIAHLLKGDSSRFLREKFPHLKKVCGKEHFWTQSYSVGTAGAV